MTRIKRWGVGIAVSAAVAALAPAGAASPTTDYTWSGSADTTNWSTVGNWSPGVPVAPIGKLIFPDLNGTCSSPDTCYTSSDDLGPISIDQLVVDDTDNYFVETGGVVSPSISIGSGGVQANATVDSTGNQASFSMPILLTAPQTWTFGGAVNPANRYQGQLALGLGVNGNDALTITATPGFAHTNGPPLLELNGENANVDSEVGQVIVENGVNLQLALSAGLNDTDLDPIDVTSGALLSVDDAPSETGPITLTGGDLVVGAGESPDGSLAANGAVTLDSSSVADFYIDDNGSTPSTDFTQLSATGDIALGGSGLSLQQGTVGGSTCEKLSVGDTATLVSDPTSTVSGTFASAPNGSIVPMSGCGSQAYPVQIAYTTHAVTAKVVSRATTTTLSAPSSATASKQVTLTATVAGAGAPTGTVAFSDGADPISGCETVALARATATTATATCTTSFAAAGRHTLAARFAGAADFDSSASGGRTVVVSAISTPPPPGSGTPKVNGADVTTMKTSSGTPEVAVPVSCASGGASCTVKAALTVTEKVKSTKGHKTKTKRTIVIGSATVTIKAGKTGRILVKLNRTGRKLLAARHRLRVNLTFTHRVNGKTKTLLTKFITIKR